MKVQQKVMVTVTEVDLPRKRIAFSMKANPEIGPTNAGARTSPGARVPQAAHARPRNPPPPNRWIGLPKH